MLGRLDEVKPKRETALFFKMVDDMITNFDYEISTHLSDYYNGPPLDGQNPVGLLPPFASNDPRFFRTETLAW